VGSEEGATLSDGQAGEGGPLQSESQTGQWLRV
jgi:hypothetical protein